MNKQQKSLDELYKAVITGTDDFEFKPNEEYKNAAIDPRLNINKKVEKLNKEKMNIQLKENIIISDNILQKFFSLNNDKFYACIQKMNEWGFEIMFKEFIIYYYFKIIKDNYLKNYILMNIQTILNTLKTQLELKMMEGMKNFNFATIQDDNEIEKVKNEIIGKETALMSLQSPAFNEFAPVSQEVKTKLDAGKKRDFRMEVLNRLKYENPGLLD